MSEPMTPEPGKNPVQAVTVLVARRALAGHEPAFIRANDGMRAAARLFPGHLGGYMVHPEGGSDGPDARLYHVMFAFDTEANLRQWQKSPERAHWIAEMSPHVETESDHRLIPGLEHWYAMPGAAGPRPPPPRWKVAVVTWLGICPTVWLALGLLTPLLASWPSLPRVALVTVLVVVVMTWGIAPLMTRLFARWLYPRTISKL